MLITQLSFGTQDILQPNHVGNRVIVGPTGVSMPIGTFLVMRRGKDSCALRFTKAHRGEDKGKQNFWTSGEESLYAEYDWFYQANGLPRFTIPDTNSGHGNLVKKPLYGLGRLAFQTGNIQVDCGSFRPSWYYPTSVTFFEKTKLADYGIEIAPTQWTNISDVDLMDSRLVWYRYDERRKVIDIPITKLW